ncbi:hypothetical protein U0070_026716 [Myodes glareolus]|uniref:Outer dense fiber protein 4 n=1 Tax=Myodes glareolus TaxID=447135 RepID=A0AAW0JL19_MYOGA
MHSSRWIAQVVASEFSLVAFLLLLVMVFSKKWVYPSKSRFHQRYPKNITHRLYTSIHTMSTGLLYTCISRSCSVSDSGKGESLHPGPGPACLDLSGGPHGLLPSYQPSSFGLQDGFAGMVISRDHVLSLVNSPDPVEDVISLDNFKLWTNHPVLGVAKISFTLAVGLGFALTAWLHLLYLPRLQKMPFFGLIGIILSFCEVSFIFLTLLLFPVNLWMYELKKNISVPIGWTYFVGWLVLILHLTCGILCYLNHKNFWKLIMDSSSSIISSPRNSASQGSRRSTVQPSNSQEDIPDPDKQKEKQGVIRFI